MKFGKGTNYCMVKTEGLFSHKPSDFHASLEPIRALRSEMDYLLSLQGLCLTWDVRLAHPDAVLCLQAQEAQYSVQVS